MTVNRIRAGSARRKLLLAGAVLIAVPAEAQQATQPAMPPANPSDIVVTGSRLPAGVKAPTPLTVLGS